MSSLSDKPANPRRYGKALEKAILAAAWQELKKVGYDKLTFDTVAKRAGTSKAVLYRRWSNRPELVRAAMRNHVSILSEPVPNTGSLRADVILLLERISNQLSEIGGNVLWGIIADVINKAKKKPGQHVAVFGSSNLCLSLIQEGLLDELRLMVNPVVLGHGTPLFSGLNKPLKLDLTRERTFKSGNVLLTYNVNK